MRIWKASVAGLLTFASLAPGAFAQIPTAAPLPGLGGGAAAATSAVSTASGAAGSAKTIWGFFGITKEGCAACKKKFCASNLGMMVNGMIAPMGAMTGGILQPCCPTVPAAADLAAIAAGPGGPNGAAAVAAQIKQSEADAKARVAAVEYLGTVDCRRWPKAAEALANSLRSDQNECVRYAAARVLSNGCCCTKITIDALKRTVSTVPMTIEKDGKQVPDPDPVEGSERVRAAAMAALSRCQYLNPETIENRGGEDGPKLTPPPVGGERSASHNPQDSEVQLAQLLSPDPEVRRAAFHEEVRRKPAAQILAEARRELDLARRRGPAPIMTTGNRSLMHAIARAAQKDHTAPPVAGGPVGTMPVMTPVPATTVFVPQGDAGVVAAGVVQQEAAAVQYPTQPRPQSRPQAPARTGGKSLVEILQRSRGRDGR